MADTNTASQSSSKEPEIKSSASEATSPTTATTSLSPVSPSTSKPVLRATSSNVDVTTTNGSTTLRKSSFDDIIGKYDTYQQKLRDGTLSFEEENSSLKGGDANNGSDGQGDADGRKGNRKNAQSKRLWNLPKSVRSLWRTSDKKKNGPNKVPMAKPRVTADMVDTEDKESPESKPRSKPWKSLFRVQNNSVQQN